MNANNPVRWIALEALAEEKDALVALRAGNKCPIATEAQHTAAIAECEERIASIQAKLDDESKLAEWWDSVPESARCAMLNT